MSEQSPEILTYAEAFERVLAQCAPLGETSVGLGEVVGRVPVRDVCALNDDPIAAKSAMDGFALRSDATTKAGPERPVTFSYEEVLGAGRVSSAVVAGRKAVRIMTGAPLPRGANAVVKQEDTVGAGEGRFSIRQPLQPGENVISVGASLRAGQVLVEAGTPVTAQGMGLFASQGMTRVEVHHRPRVAILSLGDELIEPGEALAPGKIYVSNSYAMEAECRRVGAQARRLGIAGDDPQLIAGMLRPCLKESPEDRSPLTCEVVLTLGGSHQGDFDFAGDVLEQLGTTLHFRRIAINFGGSTLFATRQGTLFFGLPGTPSAAWLAYEVLVRPALMRLAGRKTVRRPMLQARLTEALNVPTGRTHFIPARLHLDGGREPTVTPLTRGMNRSLPPSLLANGLIHWPADTGHLDADTPVPVEVLELGA